MSVQAEERKEHIQLCSNSAVLSERNINLASTIPANVDSLMTPNVHIGRVTLSFQGPVQDDSWQ